MDALDRKLVQLVDSLRGSVQFEQDEISAVLLGLSNVTDSDLRIFEAKTFSRLGYISLDKTKISDFVIQSLSKQTQLNFLRLDQTAISGVGFNQTPFSSLKRLDLRDCTEFGRVGAEHLCRFQKLEMLTLNGTAIDDACLVYIAQLPNLIHLQIERTAITDAGLKHLYNMRALKFVSLLQTATTKSGSQQLYDAVPSLVRQLFF